MHKLSEKVKKKLDFLSSRLFCGRCKKFSYTKLTIILLQTFWTTGTLIFKQQWNFYNSKFSKVYTNCQKKSKKWMVWVSRPFCGHFKKFSYTKLTIILLQTFWTTGTLIFKQQWNFYNSKFSKVYTNCQKNQKSGWFGFRDLFVVISRNYLTGNLL